MPFPNTIETLLIVLFAILPGYVGDSVYARVAGVDWRESPWRAVLRILVISVAGAYLYALIAGAFNALFGLALPLPMYALPVVLAHPRVLAAEGVVRTGRALLGHIAGSVLVALAAPRAMRAFPKRGTWPSAWDAMVREYVRGRWVMVELKNGQFFLAKLQAADASVAAAERDLVLEEPSQFDPATQTFVADTTQYLLLSPPSPILRETNASRTRARQLRPAEALMSEKREGTTRARPEEIRKGVVQPEKPTKLPNVAPPRPVSTTTPPPNSKKP